MLRRSFLCWNRFCSTARHSVAARGRLLPLGRILRRNRRERHDEAGAAFREVERVYCSIVRFDDRLDDGQAQACASGSPAARQVGAVETIEEELRIVVAKPAPIVLHGKDGAPLEAKQLDGDVTLGLDEPRGIFHQIEHHLLESPGIPQHVGSFSREDDVRLAFSEDGVEGIQHVVREAVQVDADQLGGGRVVFDSLEGQQIIRQSAQAFALADDDGAEFLMHFWGQIWIQQELGVAMDRRQRRAQLMCHVAHELRLAAFFESEVTLPRLGCLGEGVETPREFVGLVQAIVRLERDVRTSLERGGFPNEQAKRFREEIADEKAEGKDSRTEGNEKQKRLRRYVEGEDADDNDR